VWTRARRNERGSRDGRGGKTVSTLLLVKSFQFGLQEAEHKPRFLKKGKKKE
jgi:hypothetical protein